MQNDWRQLKALFQTALEREPEERAAFLADACQDEGVRHQVEGLLASYESAGDFLESPAASGGTAPSGMRLLPSMSLGPYEIVHLLGAGGMGEVYRARDARLERDVALKVLPAEYAADQSRVRRFEQEARAASALNHPNIVTVYDTGTVEGRPFIVSELLEGETLRERLGGKPLPPRKVIEYGTQLAHGLAAAHGRGIVHRDLKPENVFITRDGRTKILDFGLAKLHAPGGPLQEGGRPPHASEAGLVLGTVGYMAPEQVRGLPVDHRADIFAMGALLFEMLCGRRAFGGDSSADVMSAVLHQDPSLTDDCDVAIPPAYDRVVRRCLEKSPEERFQSASDLAFALQELSRSSDARQQESAERSLVQVYGRRASDHAAAESVLPAAGGRAAVWRRRPAVTVAIVALLTVTTFAVWTVRVRSPQEPASAAAAPAVQRIAVLPLRNLGSAQHQYVADGLTDLVIARLSEVSALQVISRTSSMQFRDSAKMLPEIARDLRADAIVEGSVFPLGNRFRLSVRLVHAGTDVPLWATTSERDVSELWMVEGELVRGIASSIHAPLTPDEERRLIAGRQIHPDAQTQYLRGLAALRELLPETVQAAAAHFEAAVRIEPDFARAWALLSHAYWFLGSTATSSQHRALLTQRTKVAAQRALAVDETLPRAHVALAQTNFYFEWNWMVAETGFRRAIALDASDPDAREKLGWFLASRGRFDEALAEMRVARTLDPISAERRSPLAAVLYYARRYEEANQELVALLAEKPHWPPAQLGLARVLAARGLNAEALHELDSPSLRASIFAQAERARLEAMSGQRPKAIETLKVLHARRQSGEYVPSDGLALVHLALGDDGAAQALLEKALEEREPSLVWIRVDPRLDDLKSNQKLYAIVDRLTNKRN